MGRRILRASPTAAGPVFGETGGRLIGIHCILLSDNCIRSSATPTIVLRPRRHLSWHLSGVLAILHLCLTIFGYFWDLWASFWNRWAPLWDTWATSCCMGGPCIEFKQFVARFWTLWIPFFTIGNHYFAYLGLEWWKFDMLWAT